MISFCKKKALQRIGSSGIEDAIKKEGKWLQQLFPIVQLRESADPDQAIEPSFPSKTSGDGDGDPTGSTQSSTSGANRGKNTCVPIRQSGKKRKTHS